MLSVHFPSSQFKYSFKRLSIFMPLMKSTKTVSEFDVSDYI